MAAAKREDKAMRTQMSRAIATAAAVIAISTTSLLPAAADWRGYEGSSQAAYGDVYRHRGFGYRDRDEGRHHGWMFQHHFFDFHRR
jgi:hypothetical protein